MEEIRRWKRGAIAIRTIVVAGIGFLICSEMDPQGMKLVETIFMLFLWLLLGLCLFQFLKGIKKYAIREKQLRDKGEILT